MTKVEIRSTPTQTRRGARSHWSAWGLSALSAFVLTVAAAQTTPALPPSDTAGPENMRVDLRALGLEQTAATAATISPTVYVLQVDADVAPSQLGAIVRGFLNAQRVLVPLNGGLPHAEAVLTMQSVRGTAPAAWTYAGVAPNQVGCVIFVSDRYAAAILDVARATGLSFQVARDFALLHEMAHCAQANETIAAVADLVRTGRVSRERVAGGMLGAGAEALIRAGRDSDIFSEVPVLAAERELSAERYADGFAILALLGAGRIEPRDIARFQSWRHQNAMHHDTSTFLRYLASEIAMNDAAVKRLHSGSLPGGFDASRVTAFLLPRWKTFEATELELRNGFTLRAGGGMQPLPTPVASR